MFHLVPASLSGIPAQTSTSTSSSPFAARRRHLATSASPSPFVVDDVNDLQSFVEYDEYRSRLEVESLIRQQQERRQREAAQLLAAQRRREQEEAIQEAIARAQAEAEHRANLQAQLERQAYAEEQQRRLRQQQLQLQAQREFERRKLIQAQFEQQARSAALARAQQQQQQQPCQQACACAPASSRRRRGPQEQAQPRRRQRQNEIEHPFAPFFRILFEQDDDDDLAAKEEKAPASTEISSKPAESSAPKVKNALESTPAQEVLAPAPVQVEATPAEATPQATMTGDNVESSKAQVDSLEDALGALFKQLFGIEVKTEPESKPKSAPAPAPAAPAATPASTAATAQQTVDKVQGPAEVPVSTTAPEESIAAVEKLQRHYRTHLQRRKALATLSSLSAQFEARRSSFTLPDALEFQPSPPPSNHEDSTTPAVAPKLAYKSSNAPFLAYENFLVNLLSKVDEVSSGGDRTVKTTRKELVRRIEDELKRLDVARDEAWEKVGSELGGDAEEEPLEPLIREVTMATESDSKVADPEEQPAVVDKATTTSDNAVNLEAESTSAVAAAADPEPEPASHEDQPARLTPEALAKLSSPTLRRLPRHEDDDSSSSTTTLSDLTLEVEEAVQHVLKHAQLLGDQVQRMEHAEV